MSDEVEIALRIIAGLEEEAVRAHAWIFAPDMNQDLGEDYEDYERRLERAVREAACHCVAERINRAGI